jgi:hypothetical protein
MTWLESIPLTVIVLGILLLLLAAALLGYRGHGWLRRRRLAETQSHDHLLSAVLGLLALLLGFTFSMSLDRYEVRRSLVVQEANALGTLWTRTQLLENTERDAINGHLRFYLAARLSWSEAEKDDGALRRAQLEQRAVWELIRQAVRKDANYPLTQGVVDAANGAFDAASARTAARSAHVPDRVFAVLVLYALLSAAMLGYTSAIKGHPHRFATGVVLILLTLALGIILDLDRPRSGAIQVSQAPLEALQQDFR